MNSIVRLNSLGLKSTAALLLSVAGLGGAALAAPQSFDFKDPKGVNNATFHLDAPLEAINGSANGVTGTVSFDAENPAATTGRISVASTSLQVPNPLMKEHLHGGQWMDVAKYPEISFEIKSLANVKTEGAQTRAEVTGTLTIHGVSKEVTLPVSMTYLKDKLGQRVPNLKGDLLVVRAHFTVLRSDYGINPAAPQDKVSNEIELNLSLAGAAVRS